MLKNTKDKLHSHALTLPPSPERAQCYRIANLAVGKSIAAALSVDHRSTDGAFLAASLMKDAGCATEEEPKKQDGYGIFTFEDGSQL